MIMSSSNSRDPRGPDALGGDFLDGACRCDRDKLYVRLIEDFVIAAFHGHATSAEAVILGDQHLGGSGILDALADLSVRRSLRSPRWASRFVIISPEIALPQCKARCIVLLLEELLPFSRCHVEGAKRIDRVQKAGEAILALLEECRITGLDLRLLLPR